MTSVSLFHTAAGMSSWALGWARHQAELAVAPEPPGLKHLIFSLCDHYEPLWGGASRELGDTRVAAWREGYAALFEDVRDGDGIPPRHSFFFPGEQYRPEWLDALGELAQKGLGEVELHLHHDGDSPKGLERDLVDYLAAFASHGHLSREPNGRLRYGFIHGNWCLANSRADGRWCGVDSELVLLFETGCYADFTFPSAPDASQPGIVNRIYWPTGRLAERAAHLRGERAEVGRRHTDRILMVQGPLALCRKPGRVRPRIENGAITGHDPPTRERVASWVAQNIHVAGRPEWVFVKVHTHGAPEHTLRSLLGEGGRTLHRELARYNDGKRWKLHYATARELYNIATAAMDGKTGDPAEFRDYLLKPPPVVA